MSEDEKYHDYYDPENKQPYSKWWWNKIVYRVDMAIEEALAWGFGGFRPETGPGSVPDLIHPIGEEDHVLKLEDIKKLRAALKQVCPDNVRFTEEGGRPNGEEEFKIWSRHAIDEIQEEINYWSWCDFPQMAEDNPGLSEEEMFDICLANNPIDDSQDFCWAFLWDDTLEIHHAYIDERIADGC